VNFKFTPCDEDIKSEGIRVLTGKNRVKELTYSDLDPIAKIFDKLLSDDENKALVDYDNIVDYFKRKQEYQRNWRAYCRE